MVEVIKTGKGRQILNLPDPKGGKDKLASVREYNL
jgi:hypothetical protein